MGTAKRELVLNIDPDNQEFVHETVTKYWKSKGFVVKEEQKPAFVKLTRGSKIDVLSGSYRVVSCNIYTMKNGISLAINYEIPGAIATTKSILESESSGIENFVYDQFKLLQQSQETVEVPSSEASIKCPHCKASIQKEWKACPACGNRLSLTCPHCEAEIQAGWKACPGCGEKIEL